MRKIFQYILMAVAVVATASCSNEMDEALQSVNNGKLQFVVGDFPTFGEGTQTRVIGTQDEGKTAWENGDQILVHLYSQKYKDQAVTLTFENGEWKSDGGTLSYLENEEPTITAVYAPDCEIKDNTIVLSEGKKYGMAEYIPAKTSISGNTLDISFERGRTYSRLRIVGLAKQTLTVTTTDFIPAGMNESGEYTYTLTTDDKGNAYLYGIFAKDATVTVMQGTVTLAGFTFSEDKDFANGTEHNKSYALDARPVIDGTLGYKETAEESDITELMNTIKNYVDNGITTIIVTGSKPALYNFYDVYTPAVSVAIFRLTEDSESSNGSGDPDSPYCGKIDLILQDVTEIVDWEFLNAYALNSINLPKVTTVGDNAFYHCWYLQELTFGSVVTLIKSEPAFSDVGRYVDGGLCHLVLNIGQTTAAAEYQPDLVTKVWWNTPWKHITLI